MRGRCAALKTSKDYEGINWEKQMGNRISLIRCKVEHAFLIVKRDFGYRKVAYRGIAKNINRFHALFGCANLLMCIQAGRTEQFRNKQATPAAGYYAHEGNSPSLGMKNRFRRCLRGCFSTFACDP